MSTEGRWGKETKTTKRELRGEVRRIGEAMGVTIIVRGETSTLEPRTYRWAFEAHGKNLTVRSSYVYASAEDAQQSGVEMAEAVLANELSVPRRKGLFG
jgi:hypothetical protein